MADPQDPLGSPSNAQVKVPECKAVLPRRCNTLGALFSSASAQDLRSLAIEKHIHDKASPRGVLEVSKDSTESEPGSPKKGNPECVNICTGSKPLSSLRKVVKQWRKKSLKRLYTFPLAVPRLIIRRSKREENAKYVNSPEADANLCNLNASWKIFSISELVAATNNFSQENLIGRGGFAEVYKGCLKNGELVAVKQLTRGTPEEKTANFLSELGIIAHLDNPNTARLIGYGVEGGLHLVLKLSSLGSLGSLLNGPREKKLDWSTRYKIALGTADGLSYLHEGCQRRIIHRDIKPDNILLTENYDPQISDFGVAMWLPRQCTHHTVFQFEGTFGYFAPEYIMHGIVDEKIDVYSFGVLLLELITGRRALDSSRQSILIWAKPLLHNNDLKELIDPCLGDDYDMEELDRMALTASLCVEYTPILRPRMSQAVVLLRGDEFVKKTQPRAMHRTYSEELLDAKEYNSTKYLNELKMHRQVAFAS